MRFPSVLAALIVVQVLPALAGETPWQEVAPGVSIRLISAGAVDAEGKGWFALEIDMPEHTKTYWRVPGETGLPTQLDFSASTGIAGHEVHWPMPQRDDTAGLVDFVYFGHTVLPIALDVESAGGTVAVEAVLGICSEICVPAQAQLTLPATETGGDKVNALRIRQALADVPVDWDSGPEPAGGIHLAEDGTAILVEIDSSVVDPDSLIVAGDLEAPLFGAPQKSPQDDLVLLPIVGKTDNSALDGLEVELSFMTPTGAYEVSRTIKAGTDANVDARGQ
jgi:DsbC/DsbD-like thiol-disulfide interchange protein